MPLIAASYVIFLLFSEHVRLLKMLKHIRVISMCVYHGGNIGGSEPYWFCMVGPLPPKTCCSRSFHGCPHGPMMAGKDHGCRLCG